MMHELSLHLMDLVINAVEANADTVHVSLTARSDWLILCVADNGKGLDDEQKKRAKDPFYTSRNVRKVGLGLSYLQAAAELVQGECCIESKVGKGTTITATFSKDHPDRMPLGNVAETILTILCAHPNMNMSFVFTSEQSEYELHTRQIKETLQDIPINHPDVMVWIEKSVQEAITEVFGGVLDEIDTRVGSH